LTKLVDTIISDPAIDQYLTDQINAMTPALMERYDDPAERIKQNTLFALRLGIAIGKEYRFIQEQEEIDTS